jgi:hypothetical protein
MNALTPDDAEYLLSLKNISNPATDLTFHSKEKLQSIYQRWTGDYKPVDLYCSACVQELFRRLMGQVGKESLPECTFDAGGRGC